MWLKVIFVVIFIPYCSKEKKCATKNVIVKLKKCIMFLKYLQCLCMRKQEGPGHLENPEKKIHKIFFHISFFFFFFTFRYSFLNYQILSLSAFHVLQKSFLFYKQLEDSG